MLELSVTYCSYKGDSSWRQKKPAELSEHLTLTHVSPLGKAPIVNQDSSSRISVECIVTSCAWLCEKIAFGSEEAPKGFRQRLDRYFRLNLRNHFKNFPKQNSATNRLRRAPVERCNETEREANLMLGWRAPHVSHIFLNSLLYWNHFYEFPLLS